MSNLRISSILCSIGCVAALAAGPAHATAPPASGALPPEVARAFQSGTLALPQPARNALGTSAAQTAWRVPVILVAFKNEPLRYGKTDFDRALFDTTGSVATGTVHDYYEWASRGRLNVTGEVVATLRLPNDREYYAENAYGLDANATPQNDYGALRDAVFLTQGTVDWSRYDLDHDGYVDLVWMVHAGQGGETSRDQNDMWSINSRASSWRLGEPIQTSTLVPGSLDRYIHVDRFSVVPELSGFHTGAISEIGVFCHEFGHALGLPDLYDTSGGGNAGPGNWSLMATGLYGANGVSPESPSHLGAWALQFLGWDQTVVPARDTTFSLSPVYSTGSVIELSFQGERQPEHFLVENRQRDRQFDRTLPFEGLIVYHVNELVIGIRIPGNAVNVGTPGLMLVEADGDSDLFFGRNHGDGTDPFPGALNRTRVDDEGAPNLRSFSGAPTQLAIHDIAQVGAAMRLSLQVRAPGWLPTQQFAPARYDPLPSYGSASTAVLADDGTDYVVRNEIRAGRPQVMLRWGGVLWDREFQVSNSTGAALDPTLAGLPGGDLAVVWSDTREGRAKLFYRARVRGVWTGERKLVELPGSCLAPAIATDRRGMVCLAFQHSESDVPRVMFMRFTYRSPFGIPRALTAPPMYPSTPAIAVSPLGVAHVVWTDHPLDPTQPPRIWFARYQPDSGLTEPLTLTRFPNYSQNGLAAVTDGNGTLHVLWGVSGPGVYELHYQRRTAAAAPLPRDTVIERQSEPFQAPTLAADPKGGLHLVYEASVSGEPQIRYRRWRPGRGWDFGSTVVSDGIDGPFAQPVAIPASNDVVTVVFSGFEGGVPRLLVRRRTLPLAPLGAPPLVAAPESPAVRVGPNPLPRGAALALIADAALPEPWLDVFDVAGRRLASVRLVRDGERWRGELTGSATRTWPAGVYFIRPRAAPGRGRSWMMLR